MIIYSWIIYYLIISEFLLFNYIFLNPELQLKDTESAIKSKLIELLTQSKGFKLVTTLALVFKKIEIEDKAKFENFFSSSAAEIIINESDIDNKFN